MTSSTGIVGYGAYLPYSRIKTEEIAEAWEKPTNPGTSMRVQEKTIPNFDEDTVTLSIEAGQNALQRAGLQATQIGAVYVGSESHPYVVKPSSGIVAEALGVRHFHLSVDTEFACKAGTAAMQIVAGLVASGKIDYGMAIGADTAQGAPGDALEYTAAAGAASIIIGKKKSKVIATLIDTLSFSSDMPDFWRRGQIKYPSHGGRFTGEPAYFTHIVESTDAFLKKTQTKAGDYDHVVFHMPNGKFPRIVAKRLGFSHEQLQTGLVVDKIGNPYSASAMIGLTRVLDWAKPNQSILLTSYGSGAGADTFSFVTTRQLSYAQKAARPTDAYIKRKRYVPYTTYIRMRRKLS